MMSNQAVTAGSSQKLHQTLNKKLNDIVSYWQMCKEDTDIHGDIIVAKLFQHPRSMNASAAICECLFIMPIKLYIPENHVFDPRTDNTHRCPVLTFPLLLQSKIHK